MKKIVALLVCIVISLPTIFSQNEESQGKKHFDIENFKAQKMAYLIREVGITPEEKNF